MIEKLWKLFIHVSLAWGFGVAIWIIHDWNGWPRLLGFLVMGMYFSLLMRRFDYVERMTDQLLKILEIFERAADGKKDNPPKI